MFEVEQVGLKLKVFVEYLKLSKFWCGMWKFYEHRKLGVAGIHHTAPTQVQGTSKSATVLFTILPLWLKIVYILTLYLSAWAKFFK